VRAYKAVDEVPPTRGGEACLVPKVAALGVLAVEERLDEGLRASNEHDPADGSGAVPWPPKGAR
jgi:hypothetical protein